MQSNFGPLCEYFLSIPGSGISVMLSDSGDSVEQWLAMQLEPLQRAILASTIQHQNMLPRFCMESTFRPDWSTTIISVRHAVS